MAGISTSLIGNKYINVNILNEIAARFTESTEKCLKTHETAADDDANSEGQHELASFFVVKRFRTQKGTPNGLPKSVWRPTRVVLRRFRRKFVLCNEG